ncbi:MAG: peptidase M4 [Gemmatimonadaceae bacterium]|nr:peptidase M4 [Gemmatimonadaceae bacterium]
MTARKRTTTPAFTLGSRVERACRVVPYERRAGDPSTRPLRIFALDPAESKLHGNVARVDVPYEPLEPGPMGKIFEVVGSEFGGDGRHILKELPALDLDARELMLSGGLEPTQSDPRFHAQMVYAVCSSLYQRFREALGRSVAWGFELPDDDGRSAIRLRVKPLAMGEPNAYYDPELGELLFGYYPAEASTRGRTLPGGYVFTCLAHDIVAHECTHALLDGLRAHFTTTTHEDVAAFHEGFADIVALLQRFSHEAVVREALRASRGRLETDRLTAIGQQFGETSGGFGPIRNAIDAAAGKVPPRYTAHTEPHDRGRSLCAAIYEAFVTIYNRKAGRFRRLATGGTGILDERAELPAELLEALTGLAATLAGQFLNICIRAIDYCPPVDIRFGDYLRAAMTADHDLVPDDPWGYREAWIDAFRRRRIYPQDVPNLGEDALFWNGPELAIPRVNALSFSELAFDGDPGRAPKATELRRQAMAIGALVTDARYRGEFGLVDRAAAMKSGKHAGLVDVDLPKVESVRAARRIGPNGEVVFDLVSEVTQRVVKLHKGRLVELHGGATVLFDPYGDVRCVIRKRVLHETRDREQLDFIARNASKYYARVKGVLRPRRGAFKAIHAGRLK